MTILLTIIILLTCVVLGFFILIQNPKGGGLSGSFGNLSSQVMGVKQTTDVMEKGTWTSMGIIAGLCIICVMFYEKPKTSNNTNTKAQRSAPAQKSAPAKAK
ncbi:MAG: preprotein translocase subunit SecG [Bacteroidota bacterium]